MGRGGLKKSESGVELGRVPFAFLTGVETQLSLSLSLSRPPLKRDWKSSELANRDAVLLD